MTANSSPLKAIIGPARSGTTWAGALVDSSPEVIYRFEPFRRMAALEPEFLKWFDKLKHESVCEEDIPRIYSVLCRAYPQTNKPPFFAEKTYRHNSFGRRQIWPLAKALPLMQKMYRAAYSPQPGPPLVFKEVTFIRPIRNILERTSVPVVYIVRHPCATVLSDVNGQLQSKMPSGRQQRLRKVLLDHAPALAERFADVVAGSDIVQRTALLWRCEIETCVPIVRQSARGMILTYEQLAEDTYAQAGKLLAHFGLGFAEQTKRFIDFLDELKSSADGDPRRTGWGDKYFSIYRNPKLAKDAWKSRISSDDRRKVEAIVEDSSTVAYCAALGHW